MNTGTGLCIKYNEEIKMSLSHNPARTTLVSEHPSQVPSPHSTLGEVKGCGPCPHRDLTTTEGTGPCRDCLGESGLVPRCTRQGREDSGNKGQGGPFWKMPSTRSIRGSLPGRESAHHSPRLERGRGPHLGAEWACESGANCIDPGRQDVACEMGLGMAKSHRVLQTLARILFFAFFSFPQKGESEPRFGLSNSRDDDPIQGAKNVKETDGVDTGLRGWSPLLPKAGSDFRTF